MSDRKWPDGEDGEVVAVLVVSEGSGKRGEWEGEGEDSWKGWLEASSWSNLCWREWMRLSLMDWKVMGDGVLSVRWMVV